MFVLVVMLVMTQEIYTFGPGGKTVEFPTQAACEKKLAEVGPGLKDNMGGAPYVAGCVTKEKFEEMIK